MSDTSKIYTVRIARTKLGELLIIDCDEDFLEENAKGFIFVDDVMDGREEPYYISNKDNWIVGSDTIPQERGIYECKLLSECWQSNHPLDPVEYDTRVSVESFKKLC